MYTLLIEIRNSKENKMLSFIVAIESESNHSYQTIVEYNSGVELFSKCSKFVSELPFRGEVLLNVYDPSVSKEKPADYFFFDC